jgi:hypothetical protein
MAQIAAPDPRRSSQTTRRPSSLPRVGSLRRVPAMVVDKAAEGPRDWGERIV